MVTIHTTDMIESSGIQFIFVAMHIVTCWW